MNILFAGTPEFAAQHLAGLLAAGISIKAVITQPDKPGKRGKKLMPSPVKTLAETHSLPVIQPDKVACSDLRKFEPDLLIVVAYGQILRQDLLDLPTFGCINVHGSLLPRWRGAAPIQRAIEAGDPETGICIMQMDAGLDTGPVLHRASTPIHISDTSASISDRLSVLGIKALVDVLPQISKNQLALMPQPEEGATYAKKIKKQEAKINWTDSGPNIVRKVHAFNPDPVCYSECVYRDKNVDKSIRVKLYQCEAIDQEHNANPGSILEVTVHGVIVAAGVGAVLIKQLQLPLGKGSILNGRDVQNSRTDIFYVGASLL